MARKNGSSSSPVLAAAPAVAHGPIGEFRNEPPADFSRDHEREAFVRALAEVKRLFPIACPVLIGGKRHKTSATIASECPFDFKTIVAESASATAEHADKAVETARRSFASWSRQSPEVRASYLLRAAKLLRERRHLLSAVMVYESAKPWREADADTCEAIDFLEYYAREAMRLGAPRRLQGYILGERNELRYDPLGVVAVIGPWNFPLAIPVGMAMAAMVAGNTVIMKPAEQTPGIAWLFAEALEEAGVPAGVFNFLPGPGEIVGARLVEHPNVQMVVFTGSKDVGLHIIRTASATPAGQPFVKRVVAEMGGKNAIIIDDSADIDSAIPDVLYSAFGFSGQKCSACSRLIAVKDVYDSVVERLREGVASLKVGPADNPGSQMSAVIDAAAARKIREYIALGESERSRIVIGDLHGLDSVGHYVPPSVFEVKSHKHRLAQEEIFGPVLSVLVAKDFDEALAMANATPYALTGGVHSRTMANLERASRDYRVGNLYLNRTTTGAIVGRQPFGGFKLSGVGSKAGGPDYLKQFLIARTVTENMMRHGFVPLVETGAELDFD